jgi:glycosyltransferase involved in cell wall biosynthesis
VLLLKPKVTIGICVKNAEKTIKDAINSVVHQDFLHELIELVVVDGQSEDRTLEVIKETLSQSDIKTTLLSENRGLGFARQMVVDNAKGDYIIWVDGDMMLSRDYVRNQVEFMEQHPAVGIAKGKYELRDGINLVDMLENLNFVLIFRNEGNTALKTLGTSGCIYRVKAIRQVKGFDKNIKGVGEDMDAEHRIKKSGWLLHITSATFYEQHRSSWKALWREYYWHGYGGHYLFKKNMKMLNLYKMLPPVAILAELLRIPKSYKLTRRKRVFLLPLHYVFKRAAWCLGFVNAYFDGYEHK